jgi:hypothetical protein
MMCAVQITSGPDRSTSGSSASAPLDRRHAHAAIAAVVGVVLLAGAGSLPWVAVRPGQSGADRLFGVAPSTEVRTYTLTDLPGTARSLYVGWGLLLALVVVAWMRPSWRRGVRVAAAVLTVALAFLTFLPGGAAVRANGFPQAGGPDTEFLAGTWLALLGMSLMAGAASTLAATRPAAPPGTPALAHPAPAVESGAVDPSPPGGPVPIAASGGRWSVRPVADPWWHRRGLVAGVAAGAVAALALVGAVLWQLAHPPVDPHADLPALVVARPVDSTPATAAAVDDRVTIGRIVPFSGGDMRAVLLAAEVRDGVRHAAGVAWNRPAASVTVTLLQFDSATAADHFQQSYDDLRRHAPGFGEVVEIPDVPGATAYPGQGEEGTEVDAVAHRGEIVVLVTAAGGAAGAVTVAETALREQYDRL